MHKVNRVGRGGQPRWFVRESVLKADATMRRTFA